MSGISSCEGLKKRVVAGGSASSTMPRSARRPLLDCRTPFDAAQPPPREQDLQSAALLCEAAYRTHFSDDELQGHMASVCALLSQAAVDDVSVHTAGDQRYVHGSHVPRIAAWSKFQGSGAARACVRAAAAPRPGLSSRPSSKPPRPHPPCPPGPACLRPPLLQVRRQPRPQRGVRRVSGHEAPGRLGGEPARAPRAAVGARGGGGPGAGGPPSPV